MNEEVTYDNISIYPGDIQPIIQILLNFEKELTVGYLFNDDAEDDKEVIEFLTSLSYQLLTETKKALENQIPLWSYKNGQFVANQTPHS